MKKLLAVSTLVAAQSVMASDFNAETVHGAFIDAFNSRQWSDVQATFTSDAVFHRATGDVAFTGPAAIVERFSSAIGANDQWNVKFQKLDTDSILEGKDGRVVERGDFAVTAGGDDSSCYAGSYMMTWVPQDDGGWGLQALAWQDVESDMSSCK